MKATHIFVYQNNMTIDKCFVHFDAPNPFPPSLSKDRTLTMYFEAPSQQGLKFCKLYFPNVEINVFKE